PIKRRQKSCSIALSMMVGALSMSRSMHSAVVMSLQLPWQYSLPCVVTGYKVVQPDSVELRHRLEVAAGRIVKQISCAFIMKEPGIIHRKLTHENQRPAI